MTTVEEETPQALRVQRFKARFICPRECGKQFPRQNSLKRHLQKPCHPKVLNRNKIYNFKRLTRPVVHVTGFDGLVHKVHRGKNGRLPCLYNCGLGFFRQDQLKSHMDLSCKRSPETTGEIPGFFPGGRGEQIDYNGSSEANPGGRRYTKYERISDNETKDWT
jgi:Zinc finger, C2H2 type